MTSESKTKSEFRVATESIKAPRAAVDGVAGMILLFAEVSGTPDQALRALTTNEVEQWWTIPGVYHLKDWNAELHIQGRWSVTVELNNGKQVHEWGEFCELDVPNKIVMTRRFGGHPLLGERETTLTYQLEPSPHGTPVTVREEGFIGRSEAANGSRSGSSTLVKDQIPLRALSGSSACQAVRRAGAQAYAMKPPKAMTRIPVRRRRPDPCCNHQSMMA